MPGFIHDKLEIKFLILYITARVIEPIPFDTVWDLASATRAWTISTLPSASPIWCGLSI